MELESRGIVCYQQEESWRWLIPCLLSCCGRVVREEILFRESEVNLAKFHVPREQKSATSSPGDRPQ